MEPLIMKRVLDASINDVYKAWTDLEEMKKWYCPDVMTVSEAEADVKVGGTYKISMKAPDGAVHTVMGKYTEVSEPNKIAFTWKWEQGMDGVESNVTIDLKEMDGKTELTLTHADLGSEDSKGKHEHGWGLQLNNLEKHLA